MKLLFVILLIFSQFVFADENNFFIECKGVYKEFSLVDPVEYDDVKVFKINNGKIQFSEAKEGSVSVNGINQENINYLWYSSRFDNHHMININRISGYIYESGIKQIGNFKNINWSFEGNCKKGTQKF